MEGDPFTVYRSVCTARAEYRDAAGKILYEAEGEAVERRQQLAGMSCLIRSYSCMAERTLVSVD